MMTVLIILLLIVLNGLFVAAEFALLGAPRAALEQMAASGNMVARHITQVLKTPRLQDRYIATGPARHHVCQPGAGHVRGAYHGRMDSGMLGRYGWASCWWRTVRPASCPWAC